jgi:hypothetical protein
VLGPWARLSGSWQHDSRVMECSPLAQLMYVRLIAYTVQHETSGTVPRSALQVVGYGLRNADALLAQLLLHGLLIDTTDIPTQQLHRYCIADTEHPWCFPLETWHKWQEAKKPPGQSREERRSRAGERAGRAAGRAAHEQSRAEQSRAEQSVERRDVDIPSPNLSPEPADRDKLTAVLDGLAHSWNGSRWEEHQ